ncbi:DUF4236 domain-containing protein [Chryseolinea lacunae]|uniref:DUF4236 domain-containing protein n=1 Tax=Chryseolinea lacunae TaxID=2801331 RepID=A0ABS1KPS2_9BACT|nr:DUF4236 domain-containing protein [Chryseolinea lacunae]MBL0741450.1 DUF4236 domain-containing protein [Chryseolinea lacunae]
MGWSFRKSMTAGPFRLSFSKSGLGLSFGVKGARVRMSSRGTYVTLGAKGIYYTQRIDSNTPSPIKPQPIYPGNEVSDGRLHTITSADLDDVTDVDSQAFVKELESKENKVSYLKILGIWPTIALVLFVGLRGLVVVKTNERYKTEFTITKANIHIRSAPSKESDVIRNAREQEKFNVRRDTLEWVEVYLGKIGETGFVRGDLGRREEVLLYRETANRFQLEPVYGWLFFLLIVLSLAWCVYLKRVDRRRKTLELVYALDNEVNSLHKKFLEYFNEFLQSKKIWQQLHARGVDDRKYHGGASLLVSREAVKMIAAHKLPSVYLKTNVAVPFIGLRNTELYFFPERIILKRGKEFAGIFYKNINVSIKNVRFIEEDTVPADAQIVDHTWKYINKSGGPDRRFSNNRRIPICLYSEYHFESDSGMQEVITTSKPGGMNDFVAFLKVVGEFQARM